MSPTTNRSRTDWRDAMADAASDTERTVLERWHRSGSRRPSSARNVGQGIPLDIAWPDQQRACSSEELDARDREALGGGWLINVGPSIGEHSRTTRPDRKDLS